VIDFNGLNNVWSFLDENIREVEKILTLSIDHIILKILLCNNLEFVDNDNLQKKIISEISIKLHNHIFEVTELQEILFYNIGDNIQKEVINIICIYLNNN